MCTDEHIYFTVFFLGSTDNYCSVYFTVLTGEGHFWTYLLFRQHEWIKFQVQQTVHVYTIRRNTTCFSYNSINYTLYLVLIFLICYIYFGKPEQVRATGPSNPFEYTKIWFSDLVWTLWTVIKNNQPRLGINDWIYINEIHCKDISYIINYYQ